MKKKKKHLKIKKFCAEAKKYNLHDNDLIETINEFIKLNREESQNKRLSSNKR